jgi:hypothetical protein
MSAPPPSDNIGSILGGSGAAVLSVIGVIYTAINHKRVKAKCCGKQFEVELDIGSTEEGATAPKVVKTAKVHPEPEPEADVEKGDSA